MSKKTVYICDNCRKEFKNTKHLATKCQINLEVPTDTSQSRLGVKVSVYSIVGRRADHFCKDCLLSFIDRANLKVQTFPKDLLIANKQEDEH